jgi:hypothetical protein
MTNHACSALKHNHVNVLYAVVLWSVWKLRNNVFSRTTLRWDAKGVGKLCKTIMKLGVLVNNSEDAAILKGWARELEERSARLMRLPGGCLMLEHGRWTSTKIIKTPEWVVGLLGVRGCVLRTLSSNVSGNSSVCSEDSSSNVSISRSFDAILVSERENAVSFDNCNVTIPGP